MDAPCDGTGAPGRGARWHQPDRLRPGARRGGARRSVQRGGSAARSHRACRDRRDPPRGRAAGNARSCVAWCCTRRCSLAACARWRRSGRRSDASCSAPDATTCIRCISRTGISTRWISSATRSATTWRWKAACWRGMCAALRASRGGCATVQTIQSVTCIKNPSRPAREVDRAKHEGKVIGPAHCALSCGPAAGSGRPDHPHPRALRALDLSRSRGRG